MRRAAVAALVAALVWASASGGQVTLRDGSAVASAVAAVTPAGVELASDPPVVITWDRVLAVGGERAADAEPFMPMADELWRARTRLARGDVRLAQPIFEAWFARADGSAGATRLVVAEGLLVCRQARLAQVAGVEAWLAALALRRAGDGAGALGFERVIDAATGLAPGFPPIWLAGPAVESFALAPTDPTGDAVVDALASIYRESAAAETGAPMAGRAGADLDDEAVRLVRAMADAMSDVPAVRDRARTLLRAGLSRDEGTWREAWRRAALGRSMMLAGDPAERDEGLVHLLHVPARFMDDQPYLAGVALALASAELASRGDRAGADALAADLARLPESHPARAWLATRRGAGAETVATLPAPDTDTQE